MKIEEYICQNPERLDTFLSKEIGQTRSQVSALIKSDSVWVDNKQVPRPGVKLKIDQKIRIEFPEAKVAKAFDKKIEINIV